jgi:hypothetical protein
MGQQIAWSEIGRRIAWSEIGRFPKTAAGVGDYNCFWEAVTGLACAEVE